MFRPNAQRPPFISTLVYLILSLPLGIVYFVLVVTGLAVSIGTLVIWIGIPLLLITFLLIHGMAEIERQLIARLLRQPLPSRPTSRPPQQNYLQRCGTLLRDSRTWTSSLYMLLKLPMGIVSFVMALTLPLVSVVFALFPLVYLLNLYIDMILQKNGIQSSSILIPYFIEIHDGFDFATFAKTFLIVPIGLVLCFMTYYFLQGLVTFSRELAYALLGPSDHVERNAEASMAHLDSEDSKLVAQRDAEFSRF